MSDKPIYCGNGRRVSTQNGTFRSVSICLSDIPKEFITTSKNGKKYVKINVSDMDQKNKWGNDVYITIDQWKPDPNYKNENKVATAEQQENSEDLPF